MKAIIQTGGKQYNIAEGDIIYVEKLPVDTGDTVTFDQVVAVYENEKVKLGSPLLGDVLVTAKVVKNGKAKKIMVFKYNAKKNYRRRQGHRQPYTKVQIEKISVK